MSILIFIHMLYVNIYSKMDRRIETGDSLRVILVQHDNMKRLDSPIVSANPQTHVEGSTTTLFNRDSGQIRLIHRPECRPF